MLKLELVRYSFLDVITQGLMYSRDGWMCYTMEPPVRTASAPRLAHRAIEEGLYSIRWNKGTNWRDAGLEISENGRTRVCRVCQAQRPYELLGDMAVGYQSDIQSGMLGATDDAFTELVAKVSAETEAFISIRHLDGLLSAHIERMTSKQA